MDRAGERSPSRYSRLLCHPPKAAKVTAGLELKTTMATSSSLAEPYRKEVVEMLSEGLTN